MWSSRVRLRFESTRKDQLDQQLWFFMLFHVVWKKKISSHQAACRRYISKSNTGFQSGSQEFVEAHLTERPSVSTRCQYRWTICKDVFPPDHRTPPKVQHIDGSPLLNESKEDRNKEAKQKEKDQETFTCEAQSGLSFVTGSSVYFSNSCRKLERVSPYLTE